jgi:hypothetical protein
LRSRPTELHRASRIDRLHRQCAARSSQDRDRLAVERHQRHARTGDRGELHRQLEVEPRDGIEVGRRVQHDAVAGPAQHRDQQGRRADHHEIDVLGVERDPRGRWAGAIREQQDLATAADHRPLPVGRGRDRHGIPFARGPRASGARLPTWRRTRG